MASVAVDDVLAAVDGGDGARRALEYAVTIADRYGAALHVVFVSAHENADERAEEQFAEAAALGADVGVSIEGRETAGFSRDRLTRHPGTAVLDAADDVAADIVVVPRSQEEETAVNALEKAASYVLGHASQPVLSV